MTRPAGVTASAIVAILGSIFALLFALLALASLFVESAQTQPPTKPQMVVVGALLFAAFAGIGIWTSVGLLRLRSWARTSILIFAGFLVAMCIFSLVVTMAVPIPPEMARAEQTFRGTMAVAFGIPLVIGIWWLFQFNRQSTKAAFASAPMADAVSRRPLSITVIAFASIFGGVTCLMAILVRAPAFLFGANFTGWGAGVIFAIFAALSLFIGKGLLELREEARILAIGWFGFSLAHTGLVTLVPPLRQRLLESQRSLAQNQPNPIPFDPGMLLTLSFAVAAILAAIAIWLLIRNRAAFGRAENH
jgi:hypothetical protein